MPLSASPHEAAADAGTAIDPAALDAELERLRDGAPGTLVVEPAGGLMVPITPTFLTADWLARRRDALVLVARSGLGTLNHTLLTVEALAARGHRPRALVLVGPPHRSNAATLRDRTGLPLFELPVLDPLDGAALADWPGLGALAEVLA